jgi:hypothetical protein
MLGDASGEVQKELHAVGMSCEQRQALAVASGAEAAQAMRTSAHQLRRCCSLARSCP